MVSLCVLLCLFVTFQTIQSNSQTGSSCPISYDVYLPEWTYSIVKAYSYSECCALCESDSDCNVWSWNSERSLCGLKNGTITYGIEDYSYISSFVEGISIIPPEEVGVQHEAPESEISLATELDGYEFDFESYYEASHCSMPPEYFMPAPEPPEVPVPECKGLKDHVYSASSTLDILSGVSWEKCCKRCRKNSDCYSWNWFKERKTCFLYEGIGSIEKQKGTMCGSTA